MAEFFPALTDAHQEFIARQPMFFVATAAAGTRVNLSPKGMDSFRVLDAGTVGYLDVGGSGNETANHLAADGRITIMFCAFDRKPLILRLYGHGVSVQPGDPHWAGYAARFPTLPGTRQIFVVAVEEVQTSCGWAVPFMAFERERDTLYRYHAQLDARAEALAPGDRMG